MIDLDTTEAPPIRRGLLRLRETEPVAPVRYLSRAEFAQRIGLAPSTLSRYRLPEADCIVGTVRGWLPETVDSWEAARPSRQSSSG